MTDDNRNQQTGPPSADPIRQEPHEIKIEIPEHIRDMTPHELAEYARANPEEWEKAVKSMNDSWHKLGNTLAESVGKTVTSAALAAMTGVMTEDLAKTISGVSEQLFNADFGISAQLGKMDFGIKSEIIARRITEIEASLQRIVRSVAIANQLPDDIDADALDALYEECEELRPYITAELEKRKEELADMTADEFMDYLPTIAPRKADKEEIPAEKKTRGQQLIDEVKADLLAILNAARAARDAQAAEAVISAQQAGRDQRRQLKENAMKIGAIMGLQTGNLITFSERDLWDAFAPGKISKIGTLAQDEIDDKTGQVTKSILEKGEIMPVSAIEVSYKALFLLNTILANSVENYRERFVKDGAITFYVKGVLDQLEIDPRIKDDGQLDINRKTAGVIYLEKQFVPLLQFIGTIPGGSRYSVFSYDGYDADTDTMTVRIPYLFQLWTRTQKAFAQRKAEKQKRIDEGKRPLKKDLKPLEVNALFKPTAFKEEDTVLEIAAYITNVMLNAGAGAHKTDITFKTLIKNCPRLRERLDAIESIPKGALQENGKRINKTARYNSELRKIARAYSLIMNADKCDAVRYFYFDSFMPTKENGHSREFIPPTKSTIDGKISIKWHKIDPEN